MSLTRTRGRKLLVASMGVAAVSYVGCSSSSSGPPGTVKDAGADRGIDSRGMVGNLVAPLDSGHHADARAADSGKDAGAADAHKDTGVAMMGVGNLMVAPFDAGHD
jgi:hypothetical protein